MTKRIFYVVYFDDHRLQVALDAMRFIANPFEKTRAHITVRGPYTKSINAVGLTKKIAGTEAEADGMDSFFREDQNTVFIRCRSERIREVWQKVDFGFNPHVTVYDGPSREFAMMLLGRLSRLPVKFHFVVGQVTRLVTYKGQYTMSLREAFDEELTKRLVGEPLGISEIERMPSARRVALIELIARELPKFSSSRKGGPAVGVKTLRAN